MNDDDDDAVSAIIPWQGTSRLIPGSKDYSKSKRIKHHHRARSQSGADVGMDSDVTGDLMKLADQVSSRLQEDGLISTSSDVSPTKLSIQAEEKNRIEQPVVNDCVSDIDLFPSEHELTPQKHKHKKHRKSRSHEGRKVDTGEFENSRQISVVEKLLPEEGSDIEPSQSILSHHTGGYASRSTENQPRTGSVPSSSREASNCKISQTPWVKPAPMVAIPAARGDSQAESVNARATPQRYNVEPGLQEVQYEECDKETLWQEMLESDEELWLVRLPPGFKRKDIDSCTVPENGSADLNQQLQEKDGFVKELVTSEYLPSVQGTGMAVFLPSQHDHKLHYAGDLKGHMWIRSHFSVPELTLPEIPPDERKSLPTYLGKRLIPFGSGQQQRPTERVATDMGDAEDSFLSPVKKKKKKHHHHDASVLEIWHINEPGLEMSALDMSTTDTSLLDPSCSDTPTRKKKKKKKGKRSTEDATGLETSTLDMSDIDKSLVEPNIGELEISTVDTSFAETSLLDASVSSVSKKKKKKKKKTSMENAVELQTPIVNASVLGTCLPDISINDSLLDTSDVGTPASKKKKKKKKSSRSEMETSSVMENSLLDALPVSKDMSSMSELDRSVMETSWMDVSLADSLLDTPISKNKKKKRRRSEVDATELETSFVDQSMNAEVGGTPISKKKKKKRNKTEMDTSGLELSLMDDSMADSSLLDADVSDATISKKKKKRSRSEKDASGLQMSSIDNCMADSSLLNTKISGTSLRNIKSEVYTSELETSLKDSPKADDSMQDTSITSTPGSKKKKKHKRRISDIN